MSVKTAEYMKAYRARIKASKGSSSFRKNPVTQLVTGLNDKGTVMEKGSYTGTIKDATNISQLSDALINSGVAQLGAVVQLGDDKQFNFDLVKTNLSKMEEFAKEFPKAVGCVTAITYSDTKDAVAFYSPYGDTIALSSTYGLKDASTGFEEGGFHPKNNTWGDTLVHEYGHALAYAYAKVKYGTDRNWYDEKERKYNWTAHEAGRNPKELVKTAWDSVKKDYKADGITRRAQAVNKISGYANKNAHETVAEACADYYINGNNAQKLSVAIVKELKKVLG